MKRAPLSKLLSSVLPLLLPLAMVFIVTGCSGLSSEPPVIATLIPPPPTALPAPTDASAGTQAVFGPPVSNAMVGTVTGTAEVIGTVSGHITNRTAGGVIPGGLTVTLLTSDMTSTSTNPTSRTTTSTASGDFEFKDVPIRADWVYGVATDYLGRTVSGDAVIGDPTKGTLTVPLSIYEPTSDPKVLNITSMITKIIAASDGLQVAQVIHFANSSDRMFTTDTKVGEKQFASVVLQVPNAAQVMGFMDNSGRFVLSPDGKTLSDTSPVLPNTDHVVHYIYLLPYSASGTPITQVMTYAMNGPAHFSLQPASLTLTSSQLSELTVQTDNTNGQSSYVGTLNVKPGDIFRFDLNGPVTASTSTDPSAVSQPSAPISRDLITGILIGAGFGLVVVGGLFLMRDMRNGRNERNVPARRHALAAGSGASTNVNVNPEADQLIAELAHLDQRFESGKMSRELYEKQRRRLKLKLSRLMEDV